MSLWSLWAGIIGSMVVFAVQFQTSYALVHWACHGRHHWILWPVELGALALTLVRFHLSWRDWQRAGGDSPTDVRDGPMERTRFLGPDAFGGPAARRVDHVDPRGNCLHHRPAWR